MSAIAETFLRCLENSRRNEHPYRHWLLRDALPEDVCDRITALPFEPPEIDDTGGKRATNNNTRCFFSVENQERFPVVADLSQAMQSRPVVDAIQSTCGVDLGRTSLRIEYCLDTAGFWLEPHTDIGVKKFTMLLYYSTGPGSEDWGTDVLDEDHNVVQTAPCRFNSGLIFVPADNTWHGFHKRDISGVRRTIMVNYVTEDWRARHELCFPEAFVA